PAEGGPQPGDAAVRRRGDDRPPRLRAEREGDEPARHRGARTAGRTPRPRDNGPGRQKGPPVCRPPCPPASSTMASFAARTAPAVSSRRITVASASKRWSRSGAAPQVVGTPPPVVKRSFAP